MASVSEVNVLKELHNRGRGKKRVTRRVVLILLGSVSN